MDFFPAVFGDGCIAMLQRVACIFDGESQIMMLLFIVRFSLEISHHIPKNSVFIILFTMFDPSIYRHRDKYTVDMIADNSKAKQAFDAELLADFWGYATKRLGIWHRKDTGTPPPRTDDSILQTYKFCNSYRELDKQTIYIHTKLADLRDNFPLWLCNLMMFRFIAKIETFEKLGIYHFGDATYEARLRAISGTKFGDAYLFPPQVPQTIGYQDRYDFICQYLPSIANDLAEFISGFDDISIADGVARILQKLKIGLKFHFTEILIDIAYQYPHLVNLNGRFLVGPGSKPTMKKFAPHQSPEDTCLQLIATQPSDLPYLRVDGKIMPITAEGIEGLGCEFRKYSNLKLGGGKKRLYKR